MTLRNRDISLEAPSLDPSEVEFLGRLRSNPGLAHLLVNRATISCRWDLERWIRNKTRDSSKEYLFVVRLSSEDGSLKPIGFATYAIQDSFSGVAALGICIGTEYQGNGYGKKSLELMIQYLQNVFAIRKFVFHALSSNSPSRKVFLSLGFKEVGLMEKHFFSFGSYHDVVIGELLLSRQYS